MSFRGRGLIKKFQKRFWKILKNSHVRVSGLGVRGPDPGAPTARVDAVLWHVVMEVFSRGIRLKSLRLYDPVLVT